LREKEKRIRRQAGMLLKGNKVLSAAEQRGYDAGYEEGKFAGLQEALELCKEHRRMIGFVHALRSLVNERGTDG
jgi:hypothetical protein